MKCFGMLIDGRAQATGIRRPGSDATMLIVVNAHHDLVRFTLPDCTNGTGWELVLDTNVAGSGTTRSIRDRGRLRRHRAVAAAVRVDVREASRQRGMSLASRAWRRGLPSVTVDAYNAELRDGEGFIGDRASKRAFRSLLDECATGCAGGKDPLGAKPTAELDEVGTGPAAARWVAGAGRGDPDRGRGLRAGVRGA